MAMRLAEIRRKYANQWVLIEYEKLDKDLKVVEGRVIAHARTKKAIYKGLRNTTGKNVSIEYCGRPPEKLDVMFPGGSFVTTRVFVDKIPSARLSESLSSISTASPWFRP
jgi:hypothetical protein